MRDRLIAANCLTTAVKVDIGSLSHASQCSHIQLPSVFILPNRHRTKKIVNLGTSAVQGGGEPYDAKFDTAFSFDC